MSGEQRATIDELRRDYGDVRVVDENDEYVMVLYNRDRERACVYPDGNMDQDIL